VKNGLRRLVLLVAALAAFAGVFSPDALAVGGDYVFAGGSSKERSQVRAALEVSEFDWNVVPEQVTIHLAPGIDSHAFPRHIWLDSNLLAAGIFAWAVVQDEYAHQVDYLLFDDSTRARLNLALGGKAWCHSHTPGLRHSEYGCERFASTLVWSFWPSRQNSYRPRNATDEAAAMPARQFRALVSTVLDRSVSAVAEIQ
jgi:hypothetical protein